LDSALQACLQKRWTIKMTERSAAFSEVWSSPPQA
jgi:hypothetical protein